MKFTAQSTQASTANSSDAAPPSATSGVDAAEALFVAADKAVRLALAPSVETQAGRAEPQHAPAETPIPFADRAGNGERAGQVLTFPPQPSPVGPRATLHALQEWEGYVVEVERGELVARLVDLTTGSTHEEEEAVIPLAELSESDVATVRAGSIFRWVIGYERSPSGTKKRVSQLVFRDLPRMSERDFSEARSWARETMQAFQR